MQNNKGVSIAVLVIIGLLLYGGATYLFYLLMQPDDDQTAKIVTPEEIIDSLAIKYDLNVDSLQQSASFLDALKSRITEEDIEERIYLYDDEYVLKKLIEKDPGIADSTDYFITDSLRTVVAEDELLEENFKNFIDSNKEKFELRRKLREEEEKNRMLASRLDTLSTVKSEISSENDESSKKIEELQKLNKDLLEKTQELSSKNLASLVKKYESMKPLKAARILYSMPDGNVVKILKKMNNRQAGKILASLPPSKAAALSVMIMLDDKKSVDSDSDVPKETLTKGNIF